MTMTMKVDWDYSERAAFYDKRADYSAQALDMALSKMGLKPPLKLADVGAGTAKLSRPLAERGFSISAVEPNDQMRRYGINNTKKLDIQWSAGTGEKTGLPSSSFAAVFFGSSFNVVDQPSTLRECKRILLPGGWFCCMWNHRDLDDPTQAHIEKIIKRAIPQYEYGKRREDPTEVIRESKLFGPVQHVEARFDVKMARADVVEAWKSHATLARQAGDKMSSIIREIENAISDSDSLLVPYTTRIWFAKLNQ